MLDIELDRANMIHSNLNRENFYVFEPQDILLRRGAVFVCMLLLASCGLRHSETRSSHAKIRVGDWAEYDIIGGLKQKRSVVAIEGETVQLLVETRTDENVLRADIQKKPLRSFVFAGAGQPTAPGVKSGEEEIAINGRRFHCEVFDVEEGGQGVRVWLSADAPLDGLVQMANRDNVVLRLRSFGKGNT